MPDRNGRTKNTLMESERKVQAKTSLGGAPNLPDNISLTNINLNSGHGCQPWHKTALAASDHISQRISASTLPTGIGTNVDSDCEALRTAALGASGLSAETYGRKVKNNNIKECDTASDPQMTALGASGLSVETYGRKVKNNNIKECDTASDRRAGNGHLKPGAKDIPTPIDCQLLAPPTLKESGVVFDGPIDEESSIEAISFSLASEEDILPFTFASMGSHFLTSLNEVIGRSRRAAKERRKVATGDFETFLSGWHAERKERLGSEGILEGEEPTLNLDSATLADLIRSVAARDGLDAQEIEWVLRHTARPDTHSEERSMRLLKGTLKARHHRPPSITPVMKAGRRDDPEDALLEMPMLPQPHDRRIPLDRFIQKRKGFDDGRTHVPIDEIFGRTTKCQRRLRPYLKATFEYLHLLMKDPQAPQPSALRYPFILGEEDAWPKFYGLPLAVDANFDCHVIDDSDQEQGLFDANYIQRRLQELGEFTDNQVISDLQNGFDLFANIPWGLALWQPQKNSRAFMAWGAEQTSKAVAEGTLSFTEGRMARIGHVNPWGVNVKYSEDSALKLRETTNHSKARSTEYCTNEQIDMNLHPPLRLPTAGELTRAAGIMVAAWAEICKAHPEQPELWEIMAPLQSWSDGSNYFGQFAPAERNKSIMQKFALARDKDGQLQAGTAMSNRVQFGAKPSPTDLSAVTTAINWGISRRLDQFEDLLEERAIAGDPIATRHNAPAMRSLRARRCQMLGVEQRELRLVGGYIDDFFKFMMGVLRLLAAEFIGQDEFDDTWGLPLSLPKSARGDAVKGLGNVIHFRERRRKPSKFKLERIMALLERWEGLATVETVESDHVLGLASHVFLDCPPMRIIVRGLYRDVNRQRTRIESRRAIAGQQVGREHGKRPNLIIYVTAKMDFLVGKLLEELRSSEGITLLEPDEFPISVSPDATWATDSNNEDIRRHGDSGRYVGMGGTSVSKCMANYAWIYELKGDQKRIPVHLTEYVANLISAALFGPFLKGKKIYELIDNQAAHKTIEDERAKDSRLIDLGLIRRQRLADLKIKTRTDYLPSKRNILADLLSRGKLKEFAGMAKKWEIEFRPIIDVRNTPLGAEVERLLLHLNHMDRSGNVEGEEF